MMPSGHVTPARRAVTVTLVALVVALAAVALSARGTAPQAQTAALPAPAPVPERATTSSALTGVPEGVPVNFRGREVFRVYRPLGTLSPEERARIAEGRLDMLVSDYGILPEQIQVQHGEGASELWIGERLISLITDQEAEAAGTERRAYAEWVKTRLSELMVETRREYSPEEITRGLVSVAMATLGLLVFWWALGRVTRRLINATDAMAERMHGVSIQRLELVSKTRLVAWLGTVLRLLRAVLWVAAGLAWMQFVLASLPWTRPYGRLVRPWLEAPFLFVASSVIAALPNMFYIAVIVGVNFGVIRLVHLFFRAVRDGAVRLQNFSPEWADPTFKLVRALIIAITFVAAFPYIPGSSSPAFQGVSLFIGLLVSLSSSSAISNVIAGTILTYTGAFRMGDRVEISGTTGDVVKKSLLTTHLRTIKNEIVAIPNSLVIGGSIINYATLASESGLILHTTVTIGYDAPWRRVHELLIEAALATDGIEKLPSPFVFQTALNDFYVSYEINAYTRRPHDMASLYADLHTNIQESFNKGGVEIMSPHYSSLRDGNTVTIPASHREPGYQPPRFGVSVSERDRSHDDEGDTGRGPVLDDDRCLGTARGAVPRAVARGPLPQLRRLRRTRPGACSTGNLPKGTAATGPPRRRTRSRTSGGRRNRCSCSGWARSSSRWPSGGWHEVVEWRAIRPIPHRRDDLLMGIANVSGELRLCVSLEVLFGQPRPDVHGDRRSGRMLLIGTGLGRMGGARRPGARHPPAPRGRHRGRAVHGGAVGAGFPARDVPVARPARRPARRRTGPGRDRAEARVSPDLSKFSLWDLYRGEVEAHSTTLNDGLLALEEHPEDLDRIKALMRAAHSIKGAARVVRHSAGRRGRARDGGPLRRRAVRHACPHARRPAAAARGRRHAGTPVPGCGGRARSGDRRGHRCRNAVDRRVRRCGDYTAPASSCRTGRRPPRPVPGPAAVPTDAGAPAPATAPTTAVRPRPCRSQRPRPPRAPACRAPCGSRPGRTGAGDAP